MSYEQKDNSGALFKNDDQREGKQDPLYKGQATIGGKAYWLSAWLNTAQSGSKYMALKFTPKDARPAAAPKQVDAEFNDDIPF